MSRDDGVHQLVPYKRFPPSTALLIVPLSSEYAELEASAAITIALTVQNILLMIHSIIVIYQFYRTNKPTVDIAGFYERQ